MRLILPEIATVALAATLMLGGARESLAQQSGDGFLFHTPDARLSLRAGYARANAGSDLFDFAVKNLTLKKGDFSGFALGAEIGFPFTSRIEGSLDIGYSSSSTGSEFRNFTDNLNLPIEQTTKFERAPVTANLRYYLSEPGRSIGRLAWIPSKFTPWVAGGAGVMWYRFRQEGDFVNFKTLNVFPSRLESSDWTAVVQGMAGADFTLTPRMAMTADARYLWAQANPSQDFSGFHKIDLSGVQATLGLTFRL